jgi:hypothetical protein
MSPDPVDDEETTTTCLLTSTTSTTTCPRRTGRGGTRGAGPYRRSTVRRHLFGGQSSPRPGRQGRILGLGTSIGDEDVKPADVARPKSPRRGSHSCGRLGGGPVHPCRRAGLFIAFDQLDVWKCRVGPGCSSSSAWWGQGCAQEDIGARSSRWPSVRWSFGPLALLQAH